MQQPPRRTSSEQDHMSFIHPKVPNAAQRRKSSSSSSPAMSPNAGRIIPPVSYDPNADKSIRQLSPNISYATSGPNTSPIVRYEMHSGVVFSPPQGQQYPVTHLQPRYPSLKTSTAPVHIPPPLGAPQVQQSQQGQVPSSMPPTSYPASQVRQMHKLVNTATTFTSPPHVMPSQAYTFPSPAVLNPNVQAQQAAVTNNSALLSPPLKNKGPPRSLAPATAPAQTTMSPYSQPTAITMASPTHHPNYSYMQHGKGMLKLLHSVYILTHIFL